MKKRIFLLFVLGTIITQACFAQQSQKLDSLLLVLKDQKDDTGKVHTLNALSNQYLQAKNITDAKKYAEEALLLAEKKDFKAGMINANISFGNISKSQGTNYYYEGNYAEALKNYLAALKVYEKNDAKRKAAEVYRNIGLVYWKQGNYSEALKNHFTSLDLLKAFNDKKAIAAAYNDIGNTYKNQGNSSEGLKSYLLSLKIYDEIGDKDAMVNRLFNIAFLYEDNGNYPEALKSYLKALDLCKESGNKEGIAACYTNIGGNYYRQGKNQPDPGQKKALYYKSLDSYLIPLKNYKESGDKEGLAACYNAMGETYLELRDFPKAKQFLNDGLALFKEVGTMDDAGERYQLPLEYIRDNYELLARLDSATGNWKEAFRHYKLYLRYRDSLINEESTQKTTMAQMHYEFDKKEDSLRYQQVLTEEKLKLQTLSTGQQRLLKNYLLAGLVLFAILSFFVYRNYRTRQQLKLQTLRNKIASDLHDDVGSTLSSISIFSQMAQQQSTEVIPMLETIGESSRKMLDAMADIVWTINPENDQFEKIILRMKSFAYELLGARNIDFEFITDENIATVNVPMNIRKNLYLIFKEATNNMVKYSAADRALFSVKGEKNSLIMRIKDNGMGFDTSQSTNGNGLKNMKKRADEMGAQLVIESGPGKGTEVQLIVSV